MNETTYPMPARPRTHCWVTSARGIDNVVEVKRLHGTDHGVNGTYIVVDPHTELEIYRGTWHAVCAYVADEETEQKTLTTETSTMNDTPGHTGPRSAVHESGPMQPGFGSSRTWTRELNGTLYSFNAVLMPDGERRYFVSRFNGYVGGPKFACAWTPCREWIVKPNGTVTHVHEHDARGVVTELLIDDAPNHDVTMFTDDDDLSFTVNVSRSPWFWHVVVIVSENGAPVTYAWDYATEEGYTAGEAAQDLLTFALGTDRDETAVGDDR
jgi:hypothetical protein